MRCSFSTARFAIVATLTLGHWSIVNADPSFKVVTAPSGTRQVQTDTVVPHPDESPPGESVEGVAVPAATQSTTGWTFEVQTLWHMPALGMVTAKSDPYGVYANLDDCQKALAKKTFDLDRGNFRQPHLLPDAPVYTTTVTVGARSITTETPGGPVETMFVAECRAISDTQAQQIEGGRPIVKVEDCGKTPIFECAGQRMGGPPQRMRAVPVRPARHVYFGSDQPTSDLQRLWNDP